MEETRKNIIRLRNFSKFGDVIAFKRKQLIGKKSCLMVDFRFNVYSNCKGVEEFL